MTADREILALIFRIKGRPPTRQRRFLFSVHDRTLKKAGAWIYSALNISFKKQFKEILVGNPEGFRFAQSLFHPFVGSLFSHFQSMVTLYQTIGLKSPLPSPSSSAAHPSWAGRKERSRVNVVKVRHKFLLSFRGWGCRWKQGSQSLCLQTWGLYTLNWAVWAGRKSEIVFISTSRKMHYFWKNNNLYKWPKPKYRRPAIGDFGNLWKMKEVKKKKKRKGFWYSGGLEGSSASFSKLVLPKRHSGGS